MLMGRVNAPHFVFCGISMAEETVDSWREILSEAIQESSAQPVIGTRFRAGDRLRSIQTGLAVSALRRTQSLASSSFYSDIPMWSQF